ncbi:hypothetical protein [uncultured Gilliamella sp.]|uniref:hypothetical protein n=1 Tax=uncultured Gilliamella sp. TaxID=1193505 RepID=UPI0025F45C5D|nr:hypothetical protein [uncultured Gilliamella sp.]
MYNKAEYAQQRSKLLQDWAVIWLMGGLKNTMNNKKNKGKSAIPERMAFYLKKVFKKV